MLDAPAADAAGARRPVGRSGQDGRPCRRRRASAVLVPKTGTKTKQGGSAMLVRTDPFRELDRLLTQQVLGTAARPAAMPMDAYREKDTFYVHFDLPGVGAESITLTAEHNVLTVRAERLPVKADGTEMLIAERPTGVFSRQVILGEALDTEHITAGYTAGVLTLAIPVRESAKPHSIQVTSYDETQPVTS
jgi:HSP20 family protein